MTKYSATLYFESLQNAMDCGYCEAIESGDEKFPYIAEVVFRADDYLIEEVPDEY